MNIKEAREKCYKAGIYQLNKGESLADAIDHIDNGTARKGYKYKFDNGQLMSENQVIQRENKIAFHRSFTPASYNEDKVEDIDDITGDEDLRDNKKERGIIINCFYCGTCLRVDASIDEDDYPEPEDTIHCEGCMRDAISRLAM